MKKIVLIMAAGVLLTLGMASCNKDDDNTNNNTNTNTPTNPTNPTTVEWVDLGLPSGLLWAKCNLGATTPEGYGNYYAWGETSTKETYNWSTYRYATVDADGHLQTLTKYNTLGTYGTIDNKTTLEASDDVATAVLGSGARIPTKAEWQELLDNTTAVWTTVNSVNGRKFTAANGSSLFLPAAGYRDGSSLDFVDTYGSYWSSSLPESDLYCAWIMFFKSGNQYVDGGGHRYSGKSVRAVRSQN